MPKVSVIIPVYGVEKYIERCARSLFEQTLDDIEYIFVDDCTPDRSIEILQSVLEEYPNRIPQTRILRMEKNSGQGAVRKCGMMEAKGEYMIHCDSDDWVEPDMYETMLNNFDSDEIDIVVCEWKRYHDNYIEDLKYPYDLELALNLIGEYPQTSLCEKMVKTHLIQENEIYPFEGINNSEDSFVLYRLSVVARKVKFIHKSFYHYDCTRQNQASKTNYDYIIENCVKPSLLKFEEFCGSRLDNKTTKFLIDKIKISRKLYYLDKRTRNLEKWVHLWPECRSNIKNMKFLPWKYRHILWLTGWSETLLKFFLWCVEIKAKFQ